jgi:hypothetical protein
MKLQFINKIETPPTLEVKCKKIFDEKTSDLHPEWGGSKNCIVEWNGNEYYLTVKPKNYGIVKDGARLMLARKIFNGSAFFEIFQLGSTGQPVEPTQQPQQLSKSDMPWDKEKPDWDSINAAKSDRITKAQCLNLAAELYGKDLKNPTEILEKARILYDTFKPWLNL